MQDSPQPTPEPPAAPSLSDKAGSLKDGLSQRISITVPAERTAKERKDESDANHDFSDYSHGQESSDQQYSQEGSSVERRSEQIMGQ